VFGWGVLGALVGRGMAIFVPNLAPKRARTGGAIGGAIGAVAWLQVSGAVNDVTGRLLGAAILGSVLGLLIVIIEKVFREAWLEISSGPKDIITVNLGEKSVAIGSDSKSCTVVASGAPAVALRYRKVGGQIECEDVVRQHTTTVRAGDERNVGRIKVKVCVTS
jgi:Ca-activated chloride channel family protein